MPSNEIRHKVEQAWMDAQIGWKDDQAQRHYQEVIQPLLMAADGLAQLEIQLHDLIEYSLSKANKYF